MPRVSRLSETYSSVKLHQIEGIIGNHGTIRGHVSTRKRKTVEEILVECLIEAMKKSFRSEQESSNKNRSWLATV